MRTDNATFAAVDQSLSKEPRYVIELDFAGDGTDLVYFTSHADCLTPEGATVYASTLKRAPSGTTQRLIREEGRSEIGRISFQLVDVAEAVSTLIRTKEQAGFGVRHKRVRVYRGYSDPSFTEWAHYVLVDTQIVDDLSYQDGAYDVRCSDVQRTLRKEIFDLATTNITATVSATATTIPVRSTARFVPFAHDEGYSDAPNATVGYVRIDDEIIRYTGKTATTFTGCTRGALNTKAAAHAITDGAAADRQPKVTEVVYLEGPAPKLALAIMTGALYGQPGETLPDGWHLAVPAEYVSTASFENIGSDLWDTEDPTTGAILRFVGEKRQDGKAFIEKQVCLACNTYLAVLSDGALALRRREAVLAGASHIAVLDASNTTKVGKLQHDLGAVQNRYIIDWNYDAAREETTRTNILYDAVSEAIHGRAEPRRLELRGLYGGRVTDELLLQRFRSWTDSYANPPERLTVTLQHRMNRLEVGDIVRVQYDHVRDAAGSGGSSIDRAMEIQRVAIDWQSGVVSVDLMGSTAPGNAQSLTQAASILPDAYYAAQGTNLATYDGVSITVTGGVGHITGGTGLAAGTYYYLGDLQLDAGVSLPINGHVTLYVMGYLTINGTFDGKGRGHAGQAAGDEIVAEKLGTPGAVGATKPEGGIGWLLGFASYDTPITKGKFGSSLPVPSLRYEDGSISGLSGYSDLRGTSGGAGGNVYGPAPAPEYITTLARGGAGGNSGAGMLIVSRGGEFGADGEIDVSGADGQLGVTMDAGAYTLAAGTGAGGSSGAVLWVIDGGHTPIDLTHITTDNGRTPLPTNANRLPAYMVTDDGVVNVGGTAQLPPAVNISGFAGIDGSAAGLSGRAQFTYLAGATQPAADVPRTTGDAAAVHLWEYQNTPKTANRDRSTIEAYTTGDRDGNYAYDNIYWRKQGQSVWKLAGPTSPEATVEVLSDGSTYEFQARSVSRSGVESPSGPVQSITVANVFRTAPATPTGVAVVRNGTTLRFTWEYDPTVKFYEVRRGESWGSSVLLGRPPAPPYDVDSALPGTYLIKACDLFGAYSIEPSAVITEEHADINIVVTHDEAAGGWAGTYDGTAKTADGVVLAGTRPIASFTDPIARYVRPIAKDSVIHTTGTYISETIDLLTSLTARVEIDPRVEQVAIGEPISSWTLPIVDYADGWTIAGPLGIVSANFEIRTSDDAVTWSAWRTYVTGNYSGRYLQFRVSLTTGDDSYNCRLAQFIVTVDVPDRVLEWEDEAIPPGGKTLTFSPQFFIKPVTTIALQGADVGDEYRITEKTESSMHIEIIDSSGATKAGNADITARAY